MKKKLTSLFICIFLAAALAPGVTSATAVSEAPIYIDGKPVKTKYFMQGEHLMVPAVFFKHAGVIVGWDSHYHSVVLKKNSIMIGLPSGKNYADYLVKETNKWKRDYLATKTTDMVDGTYIPLVYSAKKLGMDVVYDSKLSRTYIHTNSSVQKKEDLYWLYQVTEAEAGEESYEGKVAVAASILNRVKSPEWPNTINEVIFQVTRYNGKDYYQYSPVLDKRIYSVQPSEETIKAVHEALSGSDPSKGAILFFNPDKTDNQWVRSRPVTTIIGNHVFAK